MKKAFAILVLALFAQSAAAFAYERGSAEYEHMKEVKKAQREEKAKRKSDPNAPKGFWRKEAERSGLAGTGNMFKNAINGAIPGSEPGSGKTAS